MAATTHEKALKNIPTVLVIFGATGDLTAKKIAPALFSLFRQGDLPEMFHLVGFSRRNLTEQEFRQYVGDVLAKQKDFNARDCERFCSLLSYRQGTFENAGDYRELRKALKRVDDRWGVCSNKLFYLAVPPEYYEGIFRELKSSGLTKTCSTEEGWTRVLVEKPFGENLAGAARLDELLGEFFRESQIYRIDHYLAKEMAQQILTFRFANNLAEQSWNNECVESINIRLWETIGVEHRGSFYDRVGALRDVGQNHLLQLLALVTMEHPASLSPEAIRAARAEVLNGLIPPDAEEVRTNALRAQYTGYRGITGVQKSSPTETYFKVRAFLDSPRWRGVPITLESGKRMGEVKKEVEITFKHPQPCFCPPNTEEHHKNKIVIALEPKEGFSMEFWSKKPGLEFAMERQTFDALRDNPNKRQYVEEYKKLLWDAFAGDQTLFASTAEVRAMWRFVDPIINAWKANAVPLTPYKPDTAEALLAAAKVNWYAPRMETTSPKKELGIVGLGKMGANIARRLVGRGWNVFGVDQPEVLERLKGEGIVGMKTLGDLVKKLASPRIIWLMVPAFSASGRIRRGKPAVSPVDEVIFGENGLLKFLSKGDIIVDGGNSYFADTVARYKKVTKRGIDFIDVGVSGGPGGALAGACIMAGGKEAVFKKIEPVIKDMAREGSYQFFNGAGAGHFVKMVHNGIEYGMMQSLAEGFEILKKSKYKLDLTRVTDIYNHGSVIESRLTGWLYGAFKAHGEDLKEISGVVGHTGEGAWTVKTAKQMNIKAKVIEEALKFRVNSAKHPSYAGKVLSALREQFGGHKAK